VTITSGLSTCTACTSGYYCGSGASTCLACPSGFYAAGTANTDCTSCDKGTYSAAAASGCTDCSAGTVSSYPFSYSCLIHYLFSLWYHRLHLVPLISNNLQYGAISASASCSACSSGKYSTGGTSSCTACSVGKHASSDGSSECDDCEAGKVHFF
jgi:syndecan 4